jgi:murein DD-endopeptidase MepM/ murein hydrolase activator NlpD
MSTSVSPPATLEGRVIAPGALEASAPSHEDSTPANFATVIDSLSGLVSRLGTIPSLMPAAGELSSPFASERYHPILHITRAHQGIDVSAPLGTPVLAPAAGVVRQVGTQGSLGLVVEIDHGAGLLSLYAHLSRARVTVGQQVTRGETIANVGSTGLSTGPHLHYEVHVDGRPIDPRTFVLK